MKRQDTFLLPPSLQLPTLWDHPSVASFVLNTDDTKSMSAKEVAMRLVGSALYSSRPNLVEPLYYNVPEESNLSHPTVIVDPATSTTPLLLASVLKKRRHKMNKHKVNSILLSACCFSDPPISRNSDSYLRLLS